MKKLLMLFSMLAIVASVSAQSTILGTWKTIDDETGKERSYVEIYKAKDGLYYGKIIKLLNRAPGTEDPYCEVCPKDDYRHGKRVIGMSIVSKMKAAGDLKSASSGKILNPEDGKIYGCNMSIEDGGKKLKVRGYMGFAALGRTQTWIRVE